MSRCFGSLMVGGMVWVLASAPARAVLVDFNAPTYVDGNLVPQDSWTSTTGVTLIKVINTAGSPGPSTDGRAQFLRPGNGVVRNATKAFTAILPGADGKFWASFDLYGGLFSAGGTNVKLMWQDENGIEMARVQCTYNGCQGRSLGGGSSPAATDLYYISGAGTGLPGTNVGSTYNVDKRTYWVEIDTAGAGGTYKIYGDSIAPANLMVSAANPTGTFTYTGSTDHVGRFYVETTNASGNNDHSLVDNLSVVPSPEPATIGFLGLGVTLLARRRRVS